MHQEQEIINLVVILMRLIHVSSGGTEILKRRCESMMSDRADKQSEDYDKHIRALSTSARYVRLLTGRERFDSSSAHHWDR